MPLLRYISPFLFLPLSLSLREQRRQIRDVKKAAATITLGKGMQQAFNVVGRYHYKRLALEWTKRRAAEASGNRRVTQE